MYHIPVAELRRRRSTPDFCCGLPLNDILIVVAYNLLIIFGFSSLYTPVDAGLLEFRFCCISSRSSCSVVCWVPCWLLWLLLAYLLHCAETLHQLSWRFVSLWWHYILAAFLSGY